MRLLEFGYAVFAEVVFDPADIEHLMGLSALHYDNRCKHAGRRGGFLQGYKMQLEGSPGLPCRVSMHEADTLCKLLESVHADPDLAREMLDLFAAMRDESRRVNE